MHMGNFGFINIRALLQRDFQRVDLLWCAFDDFQQACELLEAVEPNLGDDLVKRFGKQLDDWRQEMGTAAKRQRRMSLQDLHGSLVQGKSVGTSVLQAAYTKLVSDQPLALLPSLQRKERAALKFQDASERARKESESRVRFAVLLGGFVREAQLPVVAEIAALASPEAGWKRLFGTRRSKTLRNRYRAWKPFRDW